MPIKWCLLLYARQHLQGAFIICKVPSPAPSLLARCFLITLCQLQGSSSFDTRGFVCLSTFKDYNFPHQVAFPKKRSSLSHLASRDDLLPHQDRRRALRVPLGTTQEEGPFAIDSKFSYLPFLPSSSSGGVSLRHQPSGSPSCLPLPFPSRHADFTRDPSSRTTRDPDNGTRRNFACTPTRSPDSTLPKHGAPPSSTREIDRRPCPCSNYK